MPEKGPHPDSELAAWYFIKALCISWKEIHCWRGKDEGCFELAAGSFGVFIIM